MIRRRVRSRPSVAPVTPPGDTVGTASIAISGLAVGPQSANSFTGWTSPATTVFQNSSWGVTNGRYLGPLDATRLLARSIASSRDQEANVWMQRGIVYLRLTPAGKAIQLRISPETASITVSVVTGVIDGNLQDGGLSGYVGGSTITTTFNVAQVPINSIPGYSQSNNSGHYWTIGVSGFDLYLKYNDVEYWRTKQFYHLEAGNIAIAAQPNYGFRTISATFRASVALFSNLGSKLYDFRDFGMKTLTAVGSMTAGSSTLTLTSNPGFAIGDRVCIATGGEAGGGIPGERGVGGQWPSLLYATIAARNSDTTQVVNKVCGVLADGLTYQWTGSAWVPYAGNLPLYLNKIVPKALVATITNVSGNTLTLNTAATVATTNANVYFDNGTLFTSNFNSDTSGIRQQPGCTVYCPEGSWVFANTTVGFSLVDQITVLGSGKLTTTLFSPPGTIECGVTVSQTTLSRVAHLGFQGNTRTDKGYMFRFNATTDQFVGSTTFVAQLLSTNGLTEHIRGVNYSNAVTEFSLSSGGTQRFIDVIHETGHKNYFQWAVNIADSANCVSEDIYFDSPWLFKGLESFRSNNSILRRATGRNVVFSSNSNTDLLLEDCSIIYQSGCGDAPWFDGVAPIGRNPSSGEPLVNLNSNIDNTSGSGSLGGIQIVNCDFDVQGTIWSGAGVFVIGMSGTVNNVTVRGKYPAKPVSAPSGLFTMPVLPAGINRAFRNDIGGRTILIDGIRVAGAITTTGVTPISSTTTGMTVRNCVVDNLSVGGTQTNNISNAAYEAL